MKSETWFLVKFFVIYPIVAGLIWHGAVYFATGKLPTIHFDDRESECGVGTLRYDC